MPASRQAVERGKDKNKRAARPKRVIRRSIITGTAILIPLVVTLFVLSFLLNSVNNVLNVVTQLVQQLPVTLGQLGEVELKALTVTIAVLTVFCLGFVAEFTARGGRVGAEFDHLMASIPALGSVYTSFNEMSELLLDSDTDSFQEVKLVEYPVEGSYTVAFKTADTPTIIEDETGSDEMMTLFMPMAPNPVMGGFVIHVSTDRVLDVDMTVEEGIRSIVTSGVAIGENQSVDGLTADEMRDLGRFDQIDQRVAPEEPVDTSNGEKNNPEERVDEYEQEATDHASATDNTNDDGT